MQLSATDMVYAISSILESPKNLSRKEFGLHLSTTDEQKRQAETQNQMSNRVTSIASSVPTAQKEDYNLEAAQELKYANFWVAYDALDKNNKTLIEAGIELAKELQKALIQIGTSIIEKKEVKLGEGYRYVFLENDYLKDVQLFQYPLALQKLALFVMESYKVTNTTLSYLIVKAPKVEGQASRDGG